MKTTDLIGAIAAIVQAASTAAIVWLTFRYVALQKALTNLQDTIVQWQTRVQIEPRLFFRVTEKREFGEPGIVGLRVGNLSAIGVWLDSVEIMISEVGPKRGIQVIQVDVMYFLLTRVVRSTSGHP